ncbi:MAG TPA: hypothetical protein PK878_03100 [bacterium]|nr:hypothetical protein [bacterium]HOL93782.1 hypothetical protein [bacterium]HPP00879.1 hypothetical protein [bacterium]
MRTIASFFMYCSVVMISSFDYCCFAAILTKIGEIHENIAFCETDAKNLLIAYQSESTEGLRYALLQYDKDQKPDEHLFPLDLSRTESVRLHGEFLYIYREDIESANGRLDVMDLRDFPDIHLVQTIPNFKGPIHDPFRYGYLVMGEGWVYQQINDSNIQYYARKTDGTLQPAKEIRENQGVYAPMLIQGDFLLGTHRLNQIRVFHISENSIDELKTIPLGFPEFVGTSLCAPAINTMIPFHNLLFTSTALTCIDVMNPPVDNEVPPEDWSSYLGALVAVEDWHTATPRIVMPEITVPTASEKRFESVAGMVIYQDLLFLYQFPFIRMWRFDGSNLIYMDQMDVSDDNLDMHVLGNWLILNAHAEGLQIFEIHYTPSKAVHWDLYE